MENMVNVFLFGKKYEVPGQPDHHGRHGICRLSAGARLRMPERLLRRLRDYLPDQGRARAESLPCLPDEGTKNDMYVATLPFFPLVKQVYDIEKVKPTEQIMMQLYPEIYSCIGCNACTKSCTQELNVMQYIAYAQRGEYEKCAEESFDCVMCGVCSSRCPAGISHPQVAMLARRLNGKYIAPKAEHLEHRVEEIQDGDFQRR